MNRYVIFIRSSVDVGDIRLVLFTEQDSWLAPFDKRSKTGRRAVVGSEPNGHVPFFTCLHAAVGVPSVVKKSI